MKKACQLQSFIDSQLVKVSNEVSIHELIEHQLDSLLMLMGIPKSTNSKQALSFIQKYISACPIFLKAYSALAETSHIASYTRPFLHTATEVFFGDHPVLDVLSGRHALFCRAYLFHRMLEELNDRVGLERGLPLSPADMSFTNIVAHTLIGDSDANLLDQTILIQLDIIIAERSVESSHCFEQNFVKQGTQQLKESNWVDVLGHWPLLGVDMTDCFYAD